MAKATSITIDYQVGSANTLYATWAWTKEHTSEYQYRWYYYTGNGIWFVGDDSTTKVKQCIYSPPENATKVKFIVKPISTKHTVNNKEVNWWAADWSTVQYYAIVNNTPATPSAPSVEIENLKLTASLENITGNATSIEFEIYRNNSKKFKTGTATIKTGRAAFSCTVTAGGEYKARCRAVRGKEKSSWSEYSGNTGTQPAASPGWYNYYAKTPTEVFLDWKNAAYADSYEIQYTQFKRYFDSSNEVSSTTVESVTRPDGTKVGHAEITGLETGKTYYFRVRAVNENGHSAWNEIVSVTVGKTPNAPTTWSSTTTAVVGEPLNLYWVHNAEDGSSQTYAELELTMDGIFQSHISIQNSTAENERDLTSVYPINTLHCIEGTNIKWRVKSKGLTLTKDGNDISWSDWSVQRNIDIYAQPVLTLDIIDGEGASLETIESFPFYISGVTGPNTQTPIGYHIDITSDDYYETVDEVGNKKIISEGQLIYSKTFNTTSDLMLEMTPAFLDLENNISYTITGTASMNSGLIAEETTTFNVAWIDDMHEPNAEIGYDEEQCLCSITPYCEDNNGDLVSGITLAVYRKEVDGGFTEILSAIPNDGTTVIDPHPSLNYARYRIVVVSDSTGSISYNDIVLPINEPAIIIQWNEDWSSYNTDAEDELEKPVWSGSLLRFPYNVDVSDSYDKDVSLIDYIGRKHPVSYYGTHLGETSTWNSVIDKNDKETIYALRRLAVYTGDVYVREPSGTGYWANISITFPLKHLDLTIPVTFTITRVEGGV